MLSSVRFKQFFRITAVWFETYSPGGSGGDTESDITVLMLHVSSESPFASERVEFEFSTN